MSQGKYLSEDEIVDLLRETSLPTILVEGSDDLAVYNRYLESKINIEDVDVLPCQGRPTLLRIFQRRAEFKNAKVVFVSDKDMWFFFGVPKEYENQIVFTDGYSLENDIYVEQSFKRLLDKEDIKKFENLIKQLSIWFAFEVNRYQETLESKCDVNTDRICPDDFLCPNFKQTINFVDPPQELVDLIHREYARALRGKNLFQALLRFLTRRTSNYSRANLLELGSKVLDNPRIEILVNKIVEKFQEYP
ncbi:DUF4435 domain-containing protein [Pseudanabaena sp. UWO310]|uniref:DUF4435 domain-containing protein n=1 Tax=Pseudanabaena sp. UWO310 TaxID=2480795 RepID=UPI0011601C35|nr:DUF4435 domain-containing protein [Pseudanabaena sp. UWO310]TYQ24980.1 DUF4435 domain-containing protein [Pseudanabaena sp. UWO310]